MHADMVEVIRCDLNSVPDGMRFICTKMVSEYEKISAIKETRYEVMVVEDAYGNRHDVFVPLDSSETRRPNTETCKRNDICPQDYFTKVLTELRDGNRDYESLLPFNIALN